MIACYLRNRSPSRVLSQEKTPEEMWSGWKPSVAHLRVFGCKCFVLIPDKNRSKMGEKYGSLVGRFHLAKEGLREKWAEVKESGGLNAKANEIKEDVIKKMNRGAEEYDHLYR